MLYRLATRMDLVRFQSRVVSLLEPGPMADKLTEAGIRVDSLGMTRGIPAPTGLTRLVRIIRSWQPDVVQTWLYHADLAGLIATRLAFPLGGGPKVAWNIRCSYMALDEYRALTGMTLKACTWLSRYPDVVITNSEAARNFHMELGYTSPRFEVVPNGFNLDKFAPDSEARLAIRKEFSIPTDAQVIGHVARFDAMKDHQTLIAALGKVLAKHPDVFCLLVGRDVDTDNTQLTSWINEAGIPRDRLRMPGERTDMERIMAAMDVHVSSSIGESFPNVVGESMACGVVNIVTDVGDSARIVGDTGKVVLPRDATALAEAVIRQLQQVSKDRSRSSARARKRIQDKFSLATVVSRMSRLYEEL